MFAAGEEHASDILLRTNCYCYAVARYVGSYCEPGLGGTGMRFPMPVRNCAASVAGVLADGGQQVSRQTVYNVAPTGHYIALAVKPATKQDDFGDFHFCEPLCCLVLAQAVHDPSHTPHASAKLTLPAVSSHAMRTGRLDAEGTWSYKAGDTLSRNTYRNGTAVRDIELAEARGAYTEWCGFFEVGADRWLALQAAAAHNPMSGACLACTHACCTLCWGCATKPACCCLLQVWPETHKLKGNDYYYSSLAGRYKLWQDLGVKASVTPLSNISPAWLAAYRSARAATRHLRQLREMLATPLHCCSQHVYAGTCTLHWKCRRDFLRVCDPAACAAAGPTS